MADTASSSPEAVGRRSARAFTLIEVLVSVGIVGVVFFSLYSAISSGFAMIQVSRENLRATQILQEKMEVIRLYRWDQVNSNGFIPTTFVEPFYATNIATNTTGLLYYGTLVVTNAPISEVYSNDLRLISASVTWTSNNKLRERSMSTLVSRYGLQNYVY
jgi:prepilin-type N-terminal cleavage/methylation domain-containing protein